RRVVDEQVWRAEVFKYVLRPGLHGGRVGHVHGGERVRQAKLAAQLGDVVLRSTAPGNLVPGPDEMWDQGPAPTTGGAGQDDDLGHGGGGGGVIRSCGR